MIFSTDRNSKQTVIFEAGDAVHHVRFEAGRPLWQVKWYRRVVVGFVLIGLAALLAFWFWLEESRSGLLIRLTEENRYQRQMLQCYKQAPLIQMSWVARETWVKGCVERAQ